MGLDATVYCDCFEQGRLLEPPPAGCHLSVSADGTVNCGSDELEVQLAFDQWMLFRACKHENGKLLHHWLGNIALIAVLRQELSCRPESYPLLLGRVLYSGTHAGDYIDVADLEALEKEVALLSRHICQDASHAPYVDDIWKKMKELVECALQVRKPISF